MKNTFHTQSWYLALLLGIVLALVGVGVATAASNLIPEELLGSQIGSTGQRGHSSNSLDTRARTAGGNIDSTHKWAWGTNIGWINFKPDSGGVSVYPDHLEGYAWGENVGWIRLGSHEGGGAHTYANTTADNYGVNREDSGELSGYAWGPNIGWINFDPAEGGVSIVPQSGVFEGYAWGENVGWISFKGGSGGTSYGVVTTFRIYFVYLPIILRTNP
jgi:hypothetical protein